MTLFALLALSAVAQQTDREADIFGAPSGGSERDEDVFGTAEETPDDARIEERLAERDDTLVFGGRLWLRTTALVSDTADPAEDIALEAPNVLDLFADARPTDRVRAYVRGRLEHDWTVPSDAVDPITGEPVESSAVLLDQAWIKGDVRQRVFFTAGRQRIKWGAGQFWNPTDFLNQQRLDPLAVEDLRTGVSLLKVHVPFEASGANLYAVANFEGADALDAIGGAVRAEVLLGQTEITASAAARDQQPVRLGADVSTGVWILDLRAEAAVAHGNAARRWMGSYHPAGDVQPTSESRDDDWIPQVVAGGDLSFRTGDEDFVSVGGEVFFNDAGYADAGLYDWLFLKGQAVPFQLGRAYAAAFVRVPGPGRWDDHTFSASAIRNLSDETQVVRADWQGLVLTWLQLDAFAQLHLGPQGEFHYRASFTPDPAVFGPEFEFLLPLLPPGTDLEPIVVPAPLVQVGIGARVRF